MQTKLVSLDASDLANLTVNAALMVLEEKNGGFKVNLDNIKIEKKTGGSIDDSELVSGIILDKEIVHSGMPRKIENGKIALISEALEIKKTEFDAKLNISSPSQIKTFMEEESQLLKDMVNKIKSTDANVVLCQNGIDDIIQHHMSKEGLLAVRRCFSFQA